MATDLDRIEAKMLEWHANSHTEYDDAPIEVMECGYEPCITAVQVVKLARALDWAILAFRALGAYGDANELERTLREVAGGGR